MTARGLRGGARRLTGCARAVPGSNEITREVGRLMPSRTAQLPPLHTSTRLRCPSRRESVSTLDEVPVNSKMERPGVSEGSTVQLLARVLLGVVRNDMIGKLLMFRSSTRTKGERPGSIPPSKATAVVSSTKRTLLFRTIEMRSKIRTMLGM